MCIKSPTAESRSPEEATAFDIWWIEEGNLLTRKQAKYYLRDDNDIDDVAGNVHLNLRRAYIVNGKSLDDVTYMRPAATRNESLRIIDRRGRDIEGDAPMSFGGQSTFDIEADSHRSANVEQFEIDRDLLQYVNQILNRAVAGNSLSAREVTIWKAAKLRDMQQHEIAAYYRLEPTDVSRALKKVNLYVWRRYNAPMLAQEQFSPCVIRRNIHLMNSVHNAAELATVRKGEQPRLEADTIFVYIVRTLRSAGLLHKYLTEPEPENKTSSVLRDMSLASDWFSAQFARRTDISDRISEAVELDCAADQHYENVRLEDANLARAKAIGIRQRILAKLIDNKSQRRDDRPSQTNPGCHLNGALKNG